MRVFATTLEYLISIIDKTPSSGPLISVGAKQMPKFETVMRFLSEWLATLFRCSTSALSNVKFLLGNCWIKFFILLVRVSLFSISVCLGRIKTSISN